MSTLDAALGGLSQLPYSVSELKTILASLGLTCPFTVSPTSHRDGIIRGTCDTEKWEGDRFHGQGWKPVV